MQKEIEQIHKREEVKENGMPEVRREYARDNC